MTSRRELLSAVVLCAVGSALVLIAVSRAWISAELAAAAPLPSHRYEQFGSKLAPGARPLALVGLAGVAALAATRNVGRVLVGGLIAAAGVGIVAVVVRALADPAAALQRAPIADAHFSGDADLGPWPYVGVVGGALLLAAGLLVVVRGRSWESMSSRYDAPASTPAGERSLWEALDRGEDPTGEPVDTGG